MSDGLDPDEVYLALRGKALGLDPGGRALTGAAATSYAAAVSIAPTPDLPRVWAVLMETGYPRGVATLVALADGTTSLYLSSGGGMIGAGGHPHVAAATLRLLGAVEQQLDRMPATLDTDLPEAGRVALRALTYEGQHVVEADEADLGYGRHPLSPVFHAAHDVITELRLIDEARR
jgi:hypothetical protein